MCDPVTMGLLTFGIGAAQSVAQYAGQQQQKKANDKAAVASWEANQEATTRRQIQEQDALRQKERQQNLAEAEAKASTETSAAAAGISGISVDNLIADVGRRAATNRATAEENTANIMSQLQSERKGYNAQAQGQINSVATPSPLSLIAGIGSAGISGYNSYLKTKQMT